MGPTVFAGIPWKNRKQIWMKDTTQPNMLDDSVYGYPETLKTSGNGYYKTGGFDFSKVDPYPPKMYFGLNKDLVYVSYPSNGARTVIRTNYDTNPIFLDVRREGGQDVIYFCTEEAYWMYNFQTNKQRRLVTFDRSDWYTRYNDEIDTCCYLHSVDRIILIVRDKVGVWGLSGSTWTPLFTPKKRF